VSVFHANSRRSLDNARATIFRMRDGHFYKFWVYIMASPTGTLYIGMTGYWSRVFANTKPAP
jgi:hypothetical protein